MDRYPLRSDGCALELLLDRGARVALVDRDRDGVIAAAAALRPRGLGLETDVTDAQALESATQRTVSAFGGFDLLVANAASRRVWGRPSPLRRRTSSSA